MNLIKLAFVNVRKSYKDFSIYFLTITIGICVFYIFNALESQEAMLQMNQGLKSVFEMVSQAMTIFSVLISVVLGFLILYANNFLIKRRKKEFGIYLTLGMDQKKVAMVSMIETMFVGFVSLVVGLVLGVFLSQFMAVMTANMFEIKLRQFTFIYSGSATIKTMIYFMVIFFIVMMFNAFSIARLKLITLLNAHKQNGSFKEKSHKISLGIFILSIMILGGSYYIAVTMDVLEQINVLSIVGGIIGTYLFYYSVSGFILTLIQSNHKKYFSGLNIFVVRQFHSRMNKTVISTSIISILLFLALSALTSTSSLMNVFDGEVELVSPYDASLTAYGDEGHLNEEKITENIGEKEVLKVFDNYSTAIVYDTDFHINEVLDDFSDYRSYVDVMKLSDFNDLRHISGYTSIELKADECYVLSNISELEAAWRSYLSEEVVVIKEQSFYSVNTEVDQMALVNSYMASNLGTIVLSDAVIEEMQLEPFMYILSGSYEEDLESNDIFLVEQVDDFNEGSDGLFMISNTKNGYIYQTLGTKMMLTFIGIYLGLIFLIACSTIIAIIQLSESDENVERYRLLYKIGARERDIKMSIFNSVLIGFLTPLSLALIHLIFGVWVINNVVVKLGNASIIDNVGYALAFMLVVYGIYFAITYSGVKGSIYRSIKVNR